MGLFGCLLVFTPSPLRDLGILHSGVLDTVLCVAAAGIKDWADGFISDLIGDCNLAHGMLGTFVKFSGGKVLLLWSRGVAGLGGTVTWGGVPALLIVLVGVRYPQGSELCCKDVVLW